MKWFRVQLSAGSAPVVTEVESAGDTDQLPDVFYVRAVSEAESIAEARRIYRRWETENQKRRRAANKAAGLCGCGRERAEGAETCVDCRARAKGLSRGRTVAEGKALRHRLSVLSQVREAWVAASNVDAFARWLKQEIEALADYSDEELKLAHPIGIWQSRKFKREPKEPLPAVRKAAPR